MQQDSAPTPEVKRKAPVGKATRTYHLLFLPQMGLEYSKVFRVLDLIANMDLRGRGAVQRTLTDIMDALWPSRTTIPQTHRKAVLSNVEDARRDLLVLREVLRHTVGRRDCKRADYRLAVEEATRFNEILRDLPLIRSLDLVHGVVRVGARGSVPKRREYAFGCGEVVRSDQWQEQKAIQLCASAITVAALDPRVETVKCQYCKRLFLTHYQAKQHCASCRDTRPRASRNPRKSGSPPVSRN